MSSQRWQLAKPWAKTKAKPKCKKWEKKIKKSWAFRSFLFGKKPFLRKNVKKYRLPEDIYSKKCAEYVKEKKEWTLLFILTWPGVPVLFIIFKGIAV